LATITARSPLPSSVAADNVSGMDINIKTINTDTNFKAGPTFLDKT
jgi:hypothetical protein